MTKYLSKSSFFVKVVTLGTLILLALVGMSLIVTNHNLGTIGGIILLFGLIVVVIYFSANSVVQIIVTEDALILKKNLGQIKIPKNQITSIAKMEFSNLTMTYGSQGFFGFIGKTMDNSKSYVKDRKHMVKITTVNNSYLISSKDLEQLVADIKQRYAL